MFDRFLLDIEPFDGIVESLKEITYKNNFTGESDPHIIIYDSKSIQYTEEDDGVVRTWHPTGLPSIEISCHKEDSKTYYMVEIKLYHCEPKPLGEIMVNSRFYSYFRPTDYHGWQAPMVIMNENIDTVARFVTYYMKLYGYSTVPDILINKYFDFTIGDPCLAKFDKDLMVPTSLRKAIRMINELDMHGYPNFNMHFFSQTKDDCLIFPIYIMESASEIMHISTEWWFEEALLEKHLQYPNRDSIQIGYCGENCLESLEMRTGDIDFLMKLLIDYFLFHNPGITANDISVCLEFDEFVAFMIENNNADYDIDADWTYNFYADGSESSPEQLKRCTELCNRYKAARQSDDQSTTNCHVQ